MRRWVGLAVALVIGLGAGAAGGIYADQAFPDQIPLIAQASGAKRLDQASYQRALRIIENQYYDPNLDYTKLSQGTVRGLVEGLNDRFSYYLDPAQYKQQLESYAGQYVGIGVEVNFSSDYPVIASVFAGSPADKAGLKAGDVILKVGTTDVHGMNAVESGTLIRGPQGTTVQLTIERDGVQQTVTAERQAITIPSVRSTPLAGGVLYIRIYSFGDSTATDFDKALKDGLPAATAVVLDLRDDGGGFIDAAQNVVSQFVGSGEVFELRDHSGHVDRRNVLGNPADPTLPLVVLVNANSASASEIVAGSLEKHGRARLVGTTTFGKGSVQQDYPLPDGADLHITIRHWFLPDGSSVERNGLTPDDAVTLANPADMFDASQPSAGYAKDAQLNAAIGLLATP